MNAPLRIGLAGLGTVGGGVVEILQRHPELLALRCGRPLEITAVSARDKNKARAFTLPTAVTWVDDALKLATLPDVDVVVELIGGSEGTARQLVEQALAGGKHVVTANKALIAHHGVALARTAEAQNVSLTLEAAVAGGIPVIKTLREGMGANTIAWLAGILNGTCNYILTEMEATRREFPEVLAEAQALGYAEADPTFDIDGIDTAHKLAILASLAFGTPVDIDGVFVEGIRHIRLDDLDFARSLGFRVKLLGITGTINGKLAQTVHPVMVKETSALASVSGPFNALEIVGDAVDRIVLEGRGAGAGPTASAVVADILDIARGNRVHPFNRPVASLQPLPAVNHDAIENAFYLRINVIDRPGVVAEVSSVMRDFGISIESLYQRARQPNEPVNLVMSTHMTTEGNMRKALHAMTSLESVNEPPVMIRIVDL